MRHRATMTSTLFLLFLLLACLRKMAFGSDVAFNPMFMKGQGCGVREEITTRIVDEISATACDFFTPNKDASKQVLRSVSITETRRIRKANEIRCFTVFDSHFTRPRSC